MRHAITQGATTAHKFREAMKLTGFFFEMDVPEICTPQAIGIAAQGAQKKRPTMKRDPSPTCIMAKWETQVSECLQHPMTCEETCCMCVKGSLLWCVHTRLRWSDVARITAEPQMNMRDGEDDGYCYSKAKWGQHKTGHNTRNVGMSLSIVACARGVSGLMWACTWLALRARENLNANDDLTLMPEILAGGT